MDNLFTTIITNGTLTGASFLLCTLCSLLTGAFIAFFYRYTEKTTQSFLLTLVILPAVIQMVIMLVNGNIGAGVAVAGAFSLVRFRSAPGSGKEITNIFLAMAAGLATGMGYLGIAALFTIIITLTGFIITKIHPEDDSERILKITIPEDLDYEGIFDDILNSYAKHYELISVKTAGMGTVFKLEYKIIPKDMTSHELIDRIRERNGNLEITYTRPVRNDTPEL